MDAFSAVSPWITTLHFCPMENRSGGELLVSGSGGMRGPTSEQEWWPGIVGRQIENLGNILIVDHLPTTVHLGIYVVGYGAGDELLHISIATNEDESTPLLEQEVPVHFIAAPHEETPGVAALQLAVRNCHIQRAGLYWLFASIGQSDSSRVPLYIQQRDAWPGYVDRDTILRHLGIMQQGQQGS